MKIVIIANADFSFNQEADAILDQADMIIAADGGANHLTSHSYIPDILIGDLDSIAPETLKSLSTGHARIISHPPRKDATDLELALDLAAQEGAKRVWLYGILGGRWDMSIANLLLAAGDKYQTIRIHIVGEGCRMHILHPAGPHHLHTRAGTTFSLLPLGGDVHGLTINGCEYPLVETSLTFGSSRGISNISCQDTVDISHTHGVLLAVELIDG